MDMNQTIRRAMSRGTVNMDAPEERPPDRPERGRPAPLPGGAGDPSNYVEAPTMNTALRDEAKAVRRGWRWRD